MNDMITISKAEYEALCTAAEDLADLKAYDMASSMLVNGDEELIPSEFVTGFSMATTHSKYIAKYADTPKLS